MVAGGRGGRFLDIIISTLFHLKEESIPVLGIQVRKNETQGIRPSLVTRPEDALRRRRTKFGV